MAITMQYRITVKCDQCGKTMVSTSDGIPPPNAVPVDWIQGAPPGSQSIREFCSIDCMQKWTPDTKPWKEET